MRMYTRHICISYNALSTCFSEVAMANILAMVGPQDFLVAGMA